MRVMLKGIHRVPRKLADGTKAIYYYAWRGGPGLRGEPGSPEFITNYLKPIRAARQQLTAPAPACDGVPRQQRIQEPVG